MKINFLKNTVSWFGKYSGYECLPNYFSKSVDSTIYYSQPNLRNKLIGKIYQSIFNWKFVPASEIQIGLQFIKRAKSGKLSHILYLERHLHILSKLSQNIPNLTGTIHLPLSQWSNDKLALLSKLNNVVILYHEEVKTFSKYINIKHVHVIKHGVDIDFFKPGDMHRINKKKILFVGHYLRDFDMMLDAYNAISVEIADTFEFHFIIPELFREDVEPLMQLAAMPNTFFHEKLSDEELLLHYQTSYVLLLPMQDSGAITAVLQALAVGLPVITNDVGGIRSYGGGSVFPVAPNADCQALVALFKSYYDSMEQRNRIAQEQRRFAVEKLDWKIIAAQHEQLYRKLQSAHSVS